jgi:hypothetical protein
VRAADAGCAASGPAKTSARASMRETEGVFIGELGERMACAA